jgi:hypothetical protein
MSCGCTNVMWMYECHVDVNVQANTTMTYNNARWRTTISCEIRTRCRLHTTTTDVSDVCATNARGVVKLAWATYNDPWREPRVTGLRREQRQVQKSSPDVSSEHYLGHNSRHNRQRQLDRHSDTRLRMIPQRTGHAAVINTSRSEADNVFYSSFEA